MIFSFFFVQDSQNPSNGSVADKTSRYDIAELATSSLMGETHTHTYTHTDLGHVVFHYESNVTVGKSKLENSITNLPWL